MNITEDYCSYEVAKLLKEKGFDEDCRARYGFDSFLHYEKYPIETSGAEIHNSILCPTIQMVMKWLREVHNVFIEISISIDLNGNYHYSYSILNKECKYVRKGYTDFDWTYEQACEAAIKYCLENLI